MEITQQASVAAKKISASANAKRRSMSRRRSSINEKGRNGAGQICRRRTGQCNCQLIVITSLHPVLPAQSSRSWILWAIYLASSWTWCIGMFLPVLLVRDYGIWGWIVFAVPNVLGAAAMGWVLRSRSSSRHILIAHARRHADGFRLSHSHFTSHLSAAFLRRSSSRRSGRISSSSRCSPRSTSRGSGVSGQTSSRRFSHTDCPARC